MHIRGYFPRKRHQNPWNVQDGSGIIFGHLLSGTGIEPMNRKVIYWRGIFVVFCLGLVLTFSGVFLFPGVLAGGFRAPTVPVPLPLPETAAAATPALTAAPVQPAFTLCPCQGDE